MSFLACVFVRVSHSDKLQDCSLDLGVLAVFIVQMRTCIFGVSLNQMVEEWASAFAILFFASIEFDFNFCHILSVSFRSPLRLIFFFFVSYFLQLLLR